MKSICILLTSILLFSNFSLTENDEVEITYKASTRGNSIELTIIQSTIKFTENNHTTQRELSQKELRELNKLIKKMDLQSIHSLVPPSTKSHFDGALAATLSIQCNGKIYKSSTFDHENPPEELKGIVAYIFGLIYIDSN